MTSPETLLTPTKISLSGLFCTGLRGYITLILGLGRHSEARVAYERAIELNFLDACIGLGEVLIALGEPRLAEEQFDNALLVDPQSTVAKSGRDQAMKAL